MTAQLVRVEGRDEALLTAVAELRLITAGQLTRLVFGRPDATSTHPRIARRAIQRLVDNRLLIRVQRRVGGVRAGSSSSVLALSDRGHRAIGRIGRLRQREPSLTFLVHQLAISELYVRLSEARYRANLEHLELVTEPRSWRPIDDGAGSVLKPDLFVLASTAQEDRLAFVEVDLGTEHRGAIGRKAGLYHSHYATGTEQAAQGVYPAVLWQSDDEDRRTDLQTWLGRDPGAGLHRVLSQEALINYLTRKEDP